MTARTWAEVGRKLPEARMLGLEKGSWVVLDRRELRKSLPYILGEAKSSRSLGLLGLPSFLCAGARDQGYFNP